MKYSTTLAAIAAPMALAKSVRNSFAERRDATLEDRNTITVGPGDDVVTLDSASSGSIDEIIIIWANPGNGASTTHVNPVSTVTETVTVQATGAAGGAGAPSMTATTNAAAATHSVVVGGTAGLVYTPPTLSAAVGDMVVFSFESTNHTVTQSTFAQPCVSMPGGKDSGFMPNVNNTVNPPPQMAMQVMVATPLWFYCAQKGHCGKGMVFSINANANKSQDAFAAAAMMQNGTASAGTPGAAAPPPPAGSAAPPPPPPAASSAAAAAPPPPAATGTSAPPAAATGAVTTGTGTVQSDGSCSCAVMCGSAQFPMAQAQGIGAFGGMPGALPAAMVETQIKAV